MKEPRVSVIMPVYNAEKYLESSIESILNQTFQDIEIICVDDGSTDDSLNILRTFKEKDLRIKILEQSNLYAGIARNNAMKIAKGNYLIFLDSDDIFKSDMIEKAYKRAIDVDADIVVFGGYYFENDIKKSFDFPALLRTDMVFDDNVFEPNDSFEYIFNFTTPAPWNKLFKREFIEKNNLYFQKYKRVNDLYFVKISLALAKRIGIVDEKLIYYRILLQKKDY